MESVAQDVDAAAPRQIPPSMSSEPVRSLDQSHQRQRNNRRRAEKKRAHAVADGEENKHGVKHAAWKKFSDALDRAVEDLGCPSSLKGALRTTAPLPKDSLPVANTAYIGKHAELTPSDQKTVRLADVPALAITTIGWDGR